MTQKEMNDILDRHDKEIKELRTNDQNLYQLAEDTNKKVDTILSALVGNKLSGDKGLTIRVEKLEEKVRVLFTFKDRMIIYSGIFIAITGFLVPVAQELIKKLLKLN